MKNICTDGFKISKSDKAALKFYLKISPTEWSENALKGMINKALKLLAKKKKIDHKIQTPPFPMVYFKDKRNKDIWKKGFEIEDNQWKALQEVYEDPEEMMKWFISNKIYARRKAIIEDNLPRLRKEHKELPTEEDALIEYIAKHFKDKEEKRQKLLQPVEAYDWDSESEEWILNQERFKARFLLRLKAELLRTDKFMTLDTNLSDKEIKKAKLYRNALRAFNSKSKFKDLQFPQIPECLREKNYV